YYYLGIAEYKIMLYNAKSALQEKDPANRDYYSKNYDTIIKRIEDSKKEFDKNFDSNNKYLSNHLDREEIFKAIENGEASVTRFSKTEGVNLVYYASKLNDDLVIRSAVPLSTIKVFTSGYLKYYFLVIILVVLLTLGLSLKLVRAIIYPVKELEAVTGKIANGDFN
ncbi:MAG: hypothetical protein RSE19_14180, partial [Myroides sp.]